MNDLLIFQDGSYVVVTDSGNQYREGIASRLIEVNKLTNGELKAVARRKAFITTTENWWFSYYRDIIFKPKTK